MVCFMLLGLRCEGLSYCESKSVVTAYVVAAIPFYIRGMQCIKRYMDTKKKIHIWNAGKYFTSIFVQIVVSVYSYYIGEVVSLFLYLFR